MRSSSCDDVSEAITPSKTVHDTVNILHLSDLHFGLEKADNGVYKGNASRQKRAFNTLIRTLVHESSVPNDWKPDIIAITGDIAWSGSPDEYQKFEEEFLLPLLEALGELPIERVITCPGNHDIMRSISLGYERPHTSWELEVSHISRESIAHARKDHFKGYTDFFYGSDSQKLCSSIILDEWPWLRFLVLNSAWDCRDNEDEGKLRVGLELLEEVVDESDPDNEVIIALFHHPHVEVPDYDPIEKRKKMRNWLHISEREALGDGDLCFALYLDQHANFILNGHIHKATDPTHSKNAKSIQLISGATYTNDSVQYHARILKLNRYGDIEPLYRDLNNSLASINGLWSVSEPKNFSALYSYWLHQNKVNELERKRLEFLRNVEEMLKRWLSEEEKEVFFLELALQAIKDLFPEIELENKFSTAYEIVEEVLEKINTLRLKGPR